MNDVDDEFGEDDRDDRGRKGREAADDDDANDREDNHNVDEKEGWSEWLDTRLAVCQVLESNAAHNSLHLHTWERELCAEYLTRSLTQPTTFARERTHTTLHRTAPHNSPWLSSPCLYLFNTVSTVLSDIHILCPVSFSTI
ncbi:hypothetical protein RRG08_032124 [Elysia crispata]|uniref:Uncharacterized protein n=1 Tax=Elysia crispata TaxID=231223 RepID=A0AAE0ZDJ1_9GAST|nr:hypothetical protein RRG08_032124 [Elysia crispata]